MFFIFPPLFLIVGVLLFIKATKVKNYPIASVLIKISAIAMVILGLVLLYNLASNNIVLPLN